jgi:carbon monoxide dehydrogenase subunit G
MKVTIDRTFPMPASAEVIWKALEDIEAVASCMPGASITERLDDRHYKGTVKLKVGPAMLTFRGEIEVKDQDASARALRLVAKGTDTSGTSAASLDLTARIEAVDGDRSNLVGHSEASVSGKAATFGGRLMDAVADQILKQFAANFAARVEAQKVSSAASPVSESHENPPSESPSLAGNAGAVSAGALAHTTAGDGTSDSEAMSGTAMRDRVSLSPAPPPAKPLNAFALLWAVLRDWLRGLFSKPTA